MDGFPKSGHNCNTSVYQDYIPYVYKPGLSVLGSHAYWEPFLVESEIYSHIIKLINGHLKLEFLFFPSIHTRGKIHGNFTNTTSTVNVDQTINELLYRIKYAANNSD